MPNVNYISPAVVHAAKKEIEKDPAAQTIDKMQKDLVSKEYDVLKLKHDLNFAKAQRGDVKIKWRESIDWCLTIDSNNPKYFLKNSAGVSLCIGFKHTIDIDTNIKNKIATTLSGLFKEGTIGRITIGSTHYYGLLKFFKKNDLTELKDEYKADLVKLLL
jgi:hypothetical protein